MSNTAINIPGGTIAQTARESNLRRFFAPYRQEF